MDFAYWLLLFWVVFAIVFAILRTVERRKKKPNVEFKCLEHMCPVDVWNYKLKLWVCSSNEACDVVVDPELRFFYEGVKPPT